MLSMPFTENLFPRLETIQGVNGPDPLALELQAGLMTCAAINAAVELGIFDLLDQPKSAAQLAQELGLHEPTLYMLLEALASIGICAAMPSPDEAVLLFTSTEKGRLLRTNEMAALVRLWGAAYQWDSWKHLAYTIRTGKPALEAMYGEGTTLWSYLSQHPEEAAIFQEGLVANSRLILPALFSTYDFSTAQTVADMGGGFGELSKALLHRYPSLQITLFDRKEVIDQVIERGISTQILLMAGNFFLNPPAKQDIYLFKNVLMDWGDDEYVRIVGQCAEVMAPSSRLLIVEPILANKTQFTRFFSLQMAMMMRLAHHRTLEEHRRLVRSAGLTLVSARPLGLEYMVLECRLGSTLEVAES
jgi:hypothetical protein